MLTAAGVGSGLDIESIISQLMALERRPLNALEGKKEGYETELSAVGQLKSAVSSFQSAMSDLKSLDAFEVYTTTSSDEDVLTASASSTASPSSFDIRVVNLAETHKMGSAQFADTDTTTIGTTGDQITITVGTESFTVDAGGLTLGGIRDALNDALDNVGVSASIVNENDTSHYLVLTSDDSGIANSMSLSFTGGMGTALGMTTIQTAEDAELLIDGTYTITRPTNVITNAVDGLTLNLHAESTSDVKLDVDRDVEAVTESAQAFVDAYNALRATIDTLREGELEADSTLRSIESGLLNILNSAPTSLGGSYSFLSEVGLSIQKDGTMSLNSTDLEEAINTDFGSVAKLFGHDNQGYVFRLESLVSGYISAAGLLDNRTDGINTRIDRVDDQIANMEFRLERKEERLRREFAALDTLIGELNATSNFLTQQLGGLG